MFPNICKEPANKWTQQKSAKLRHHKTEKFAMIPPFWTNDALNHQDSKEKVQRMFFGLNLQDSSG